MDVSLALSIKPCHSLRTSSSLGEKAGGRLPAHDETQNSRVAIDDFPKERWD